MIIEHEELSTLVPHAGRMFILDKITDANTDGWTIESETKITPDFMFYEKSVDGVPNYACFEIIAQTVSALTGLYAREKSLPPNIGFILSVTNLHFDFDTVKPGETVKVRAVRESYLENIFSFSAEIFINGRLSGKGKLTAMESQASSAIPSSHHH